jgi:hypothetical protein
MLKRRHEQPVVGPHPEASIDPIGGARNPGLAERAGREGKLRCLAASTGALVWRRNILTENNASNLQWGMAASPIIVDDAVVVLPGGREGTSVVGLPRSDRRTSLGGPPFTAGFPRGTDLEKGDPLSRLQACSLGCSVQRVTDTDGR